MLNILFMLNDSTVDSGTSSGNSSRLIVTGLLMVVLLGMLVLPYFSQKKRNKEYTEMLNSIRVGDLVKTAGGIIGRIMKIVDKGEIKTVILETGSKTDKSYMEIDINMVYCILKSSKAKTDNEENVVEDENEDEDKTEDVDDSENKPEEAETVESPEETSETEE